MAVDNYKISKEEREPGEIKWNSERNIHAECSMEASKKKTQNEKIHKNINQMQCAGRRQRWTMDNVIIMSAVIEKIRTEILNTYLFIAYTVKCFD